MLQFVADGIRHLHEHSLAHEDIKPQNVLVRADLSDVVLTDFGISQVVQHTMGVSQVRGTFELRHVS